MNTGAIYKEEKKSHEEDAENKVKYGLKAIHFGLVDTSVDRLVLEVSGSKGVGHLDEVRYYRGFDLLPKDKVDPIATRQVEVQSGPRTRETPRILEEVIENLGYAALNAAGYKAWASDIGSVNTVTVDVPNKSASVQYRRRILIPHDSVIITDDLEDFCKDEPA